jgi:uncharacterized membrane protein
MSVDSDNPGLIKQTCANCGSKVPLIRLLFPFGNSKCAACGAQNYRYYSSYRIATVFLGVWLLLVAIYVGRAWLSGKLVLPLLLVGYFLVSIAITLTAPLRVKGSQSRRDDFRRMIIYAGLFLVTMLGMRYFRMALS